VTMGNWRMPSTIREDERCPTGIATGIGTAVVAVSAVVAAVLARTPMLRLSVLTLAVGVFAAVADDGLASLAVAGSAWPVGNGFLINKMGELGWHGRTDPWFVLGLLSAVAVGTGTARVRHRLITRRRWRPLTVALDAESAGLSEFALRFQDEQAGDEATYG
jgi:hypothetical protein